MVINPLKPFFDCYFGLLSLGGRAVVLVMTGLVFGWWLYVPVHELFHAFGCIMTGGEVTELQIKTMYGGTILKELFEFITPEGEYAGRLTGFDTKGSDWIYGATVFAPYLMTLFSFFFISKAAAAKRCFIFGLLLPIFFAPLISLTGDFYEMGSLLAFQLWPGPDTMNRALISDDLFRLMDHIRSNQPDVIPNSLAPGFIVLSSIFSLALAWLTMMVAVNIKRC